MNIKLKVLLSFLFLSGISLNILSQDTITAYLDNDFNSTNIENAKYIREAIIYNNHYYVTDRDVNGKEIHYGEYKSINPWIEDGLSRHYDEQGNKYSEGSYLNGKLSGLWLYYKNDKIDAVDYNIDLSEFNKVDCYEINYVKKKKKLKKVSAIHIDSITRYLNRNIHIPARTKSQFSNFSQSIKLVIDVDGKIKCAKIVFFLDDDLSLEIYRVLLQYESKIKVDIPIPLSISIDIKEERVEKGGEIIFDIVEEPPEFRYLNYKDTKSSIEHYVTDSLRVSKPICVGRAIVSIVVEKDGSIGDIQIHKGIENCPGYAEEVRRLIKTMPAWIPGRHRGKALRVRFTIFINFDND